MKMEINNMSIDRLQESLQSLLNGNIAILHDLRFCNEISCIAIDLINKPAWCSYDEVIADEIIRISNIAYNNTSLEVLPLDDGVYDQLLAKYRRFNPNYYVGATPVKFPEEPSNEVIDRKVMCVTCEPEAYNKLYSKDICKQHAPIKEMRPRSMCHIVTPPITKRLINTTHKYPDLVGTLEKCKFVLNNDAISKEVFDKPSVQVFERDFIHECLRKGVITPDEEFEMVGELKYDGISVEAEVCGDTIISALSRGDTADNIATDLTPIFGGFKFHRAKEVPKDIIFGIKFEAVITKMNMDRLSKKRGKSYANCRNAIIGLCGSSDANMFIDYITLIPIATSLQMNRITELDFLNMYYHSGEYNRYCVFKGNYQQILFQVKQFTESAEAIRPVLPYMIDGVVISFINEKKVKMLGRINSVNQYQMAIKFNPRKVRTIFLGFTYSIGKSGEVIPMVHFKPCEFIGGIHTKQTIHSYQRFKELGLKVGDQIDIEYVNDVITYVTKPVTDHNANNTNPVEQFITKCPSCGADIVISESGKSARCPNPRCEERQYMRMVDMLDRLGFKDFADESVRALKLKTVEDILYYVSNPKQLAAIIGPTNATNFCNTFERIRITPINDYRIMSAMGFDGMADETWKLILKEYTIDELMQMTAEKLHHELSIISGIGVKTVESIVAYRSLYYDDLKAITKRITNIINTKGRSTGPKVAITGFRDPEFVCMLNEHGFDCSDKYGVTKDTNALIASDINSNSSKIIKAKKYNIPIFTKQQFVDHNNIKI